MQALGLPAAALQAFGGRVDVTVERAVCHLLMGDPLAAEATLCVAPDSAGSPDKGIAQFLLVGAYSFADTAHQHRTGPSLRISPAYVRSIAVRWQHHSAPA